MAFLRELLKNSAKNHLDENILGKQPSVSGKHYKLRLMGKGVEEGPKSTAVGLMP